MSYHAGKVTLFTAIVGALAAGCGHSGNNDPLPMGELAVPFQTQGPSGKTFRLRNAEITVQASPCQIDGDGGDGGEGGAHGDRTCIPNAVVSSEDHLGEDSVQVKLEEGYYKVKLSDSWQMEEVSSGGSTEVVEALLLSPQTQSIHISPRSTRWVEFEFGIGEKSYWLNGTLNVGVRVNEIPSNGGGGMGGSAGGSYY